MATFEFTIPSIQKVTCPAGKATSYDYDTETPGLGLRTSATGGKAFIFQGYVHDKQIRVTIGDVKSWRLDTPVRSKENSARKEARRLQSLCDAAIDPRQEKQDRKTEAEQRKTEAMRQRVTLADVWPIYIEARQHKWGELSLRDHERAVHRGGAEKKRGKGLTEPGPLSSLLDVKLSELTAARLQTWLTKENSKRPSAAARCFRLLRGFMNWCEQEADYTSLIPQDSHSARKVRETVYKSKAKEGDCLQREQLALWFEAVRKQSPVLSAYLQALLLSGARREELAGLRWENVDFQWASLTIKDKVEGERVIPLTPYISQLLVALPRRNVWVFSSPTAANGRIQDPNKAHTRALAATGLPHVSLHGLRRSFGTLAEWVECPAGVVAQIQGHKPSAIAEKHYRRRPLDLLRMWHSKIEAFILEQAGIEQPAEITGKAGLRVVA